MRKAFRHTGVLMMLGVVAVGLIGAAYALWYEDLVLETTIETGTLNADWSFHPWVDNGSEGSFSPTSGDGVGKPVVALPNVNTVSGGVASLLGLGGTGTGASNFTQINFPDGKPQPVCTGGITSVGSAPADANDVADNNSLSLTASGLFPYAGCDWEIDITNAGTVPFHIAIQNASIQRCTNAPACTTWETISINDGGPWTRGIRDRNGNAGTDEANKCLAVFGADWNYRESLPEIVTSGSPVAPVQIHAGTPLVCRVMLVLDQNAGAEGQTYKYTISWRTFQWNETPSDSVITAP